MFIVLLFGSGISLFLILHTLTNLEKFDLYVQRLLENEKTLMEVPDKDEKENPENEASTDINDVEKSVKKILTGIDPKSTAELGDQLLRNLSKELDFVQGIMYIKEQKSKKFIPSGTYALNSQEPEPFIIGDGIAGEAAEGKTMIRITDIPENYFNASSGLGDSKPKHLLFVPVVYKNQCIALIEAGSFKKPDRQTEKVLYGLSVETGKTLHKLLNI